jgi:hypothetical protein
MDVLDDFWTIRLVKSVGQIEVGKRRVNFRQLSNIVDAGHVCTGKKVMKERGRLCGVSPFRNSVLNC